MQTSILTRDDIARLESRIQETIYKGEWWASPAESPSYQLEHAGEYVDWMIRVRLSEVQGLIATIRKLQSDFDIMDEALTVSERENERLTWQFHIIHDALSEIVHGAENPRQVADVAFSKIAKEERGNE